MDLIECRDHQVVEDYVVIMAICVVVSSFSVTVFITHIYHWNTLVK